jgi:tRNA(adenine34) deaminase
MTKVSLLSKCGETVDVACMLLALEQARIAAAIGEVPIGAVVVCDGEVVATGYNRREIDVDPSAHAEFSALIAASKRLGRWRLTGCTVYVTLEPCLMCAGLMQLSRVDRCVFGASDPKGGALGTLYKLHSDERLNHRFEVTAGVCERECSALLSGFFAQLRADKNQSFADELQSQIDKKGEGGDA